MSWLGHCFRPISMQGEHGAYLAASIYLNKNLLLE